MNDNGSSKKKKKYTERAVNSIETLKNTAKSPARLVQDIGKATTKSVKEDLVKGMGQDFVEQIFGSAGGVSGEISAGQSLEMKDLVKSPEHQKVEKQLNVERHLRREEQYLVETRQNELRMELKAIMVEIVKITKETGEMSEAVQVAAMQAPTKEGVGIYHIIFFKKFLKFLVSYRKKIENAKVWLHSQNRRAGQKGWVTNYKKHGAKYLLSGEHYLSRSAG